MNDEFVVEVIAAFNKKGDLTPLYVCLERPDQSLNPCKVLKIHKKEEQNLLDTQYFIYFCTIQKNAPQDKITLRYNAKKRIWRAVF